MVFNHFQIWLRGLTRLFGAVGAVVLALSVCTTSFAQANAASTIEITEDLAARDYPLSLAGSYLAALSANKARDLGAAALFFDRALAADPDNKALIERAFLLQLADGQVEASAKLTPTILANDPKNRFARMVLGVTALREKSFKKAAKEFEQVEEGPLARLTGTLLLAWTLASDKNYDGALDLLNKLEGPQWYDTFRLYHSGLIAEAGGKTEAAATFLKAAYDADPNVIRTAEALARFNLRNGKDVEGKALVDAMRGQLSNRPSIEGLAAEIAKGEKPKRHIMTEMQGAMEVLFGLGSAIGREGGEEIAYVYLSLAAYLDPGNALPRLALGDLLEADERHQRAIENYMAIDPSSVYKTNALLRTAFGYNALDQVGKARSVLDDLLTKHPTDLVIISAYANILRARELFDESRIMYSKAIDLIKAAPEAANWSLFYSRGITNERTDRWSEAEADFRMALTLAPDQPDVLNYLGYSLIDKGMKYQEALEMIKKAVERRPEDAFIIDSLGWAYFKLKDYDNAVLNLERAVELRPQDPILNDHLGDAYWHVGRRLEAIFQWSHARDLKPTPEDLPHIVEKIEKGYMPKKNG